MQLQAMQAGWNPQQQPQQPMQPQQQQMPPQARQPMPLARTQPPYQAAGPVFLELTQVGWGTAVANCGAWSTCLHDMFTKYHQSQRLQVYHMRDVILITISTAACTLSTNMDEAGQITVRSTCACMCINSNNTYSTCTAHHLLLLHTHVTSAPQVLNKQVITRTSGRCLGCISGAWLDPAAGTLVSFDLDERRQASGGLGSLSTPPRAGNIPLSALRQVGTQGQNHAHTTMLRQAVRWLCPTDCTRQGVWVARGCALQGD